MPITRFLLISIGMWLFLPLAVLFSWPAIIWWMARILARSAQAWTATLLAIFFGMQMAVLTNQALGLHVLVFGGTVSFLELWGSESGWRRHVRDMVFGSVFCAAFLLMGQAFNLGIWLVQVGLLAIVNLSEAGLGVWWRKK